MIKAKLYLYGQETHQPIKVAQGDYKQVILEATKWGEGFGFLETGTVEILKKQLVPPITKKQEK